MPNKSPVFSDARKHISPFIYHASQNSLIGIFILIYVLYLQQDQEQEEISAQMLHYYDNKPTVNELLEKPNGFLHLLDKASKTGQGSDFILGECMEESNRLVFWF